MAETFDRQIDRWQLLAERVADELASVQKALVQATARQQEMAQEAAKLRQMKEQYLHDLAAQQQRAAPRGPVRADGRAVLGRFASAGGANGGGEDGGTGANRVELIGFGECAAH